MVGFRNVMMGIKERNSTFWLKKNSDMIHVPDSIANPVSSSCLIFGVSGQFRSLIEEVACKEKKRI